MDSLNGAAQSSQSTVGQGMCQNCHVKPVFPGHPYCSKTCGANAKKNGAQPPMQRPALSPPAGVNGYKTSAPQWSPQVPPALGRQQSPPTRESRNREVLELREGMYVLTNKMSRTVLDLSNAEPGRRCTGWQRIGSEHMGNQLWIIQKNTLNAAFTFKNFRYNNVLGLRAGTAQNESYASGCPQAFGEDQRFNEQWYIAEQAPEEYTIQCAQTKKFLGISRGDPSNDAPAICSGATEERDYQIWDLERVSRSCLEIKAIIGQWKPELLHRLLQTYGDDAEYFVLSHELRQAIWEETNLRKQKVHQHMFDYDDFVVKAREAVRAWTRDRYTNATRGYSVLFGILYGGGNKGPKAYNWYLTSDMAALVFFDAQTGREYTPAAIDGLGFKPSFITF